jgi:hypothetical protein
MEAMFTGNNTKVLTLFEIFHANRALSLRGTSEKIGVHAGCTAIESRRAVDTVGFLDGEGPLRVMDAAIGSVYFALQNGMFRSCNVFSSGEADDGYGIQDCSSKTFRSTPMSRSGRHRCCIEVWSCLEEEEVSIQEEVVRPPHLMAVCCFSVICVSCRMRVQRFNG